MAHYGLRRTDALRIKETVPGVTRVLPMLTKRMNAVHGSREVDCQLIGTFPYYPEFTQADIIQGDFLNEQEERSKASACVITLDLAERLFAGHNPLMENIVVRGYESSQVFQVKGILRERVNAEQLPQLPDSMGHTIAANVFVPLSTFKALYGERNVDRSVGNLTLEAVELTEIRVEFETVDDVIPSLPLIDEALKAGRDEVDYEIIVPIRELTALKNQKARYTRMLLYIACISLLVGGGNHEHHAGDGDRTNPGDWRPTGVGGDPGGHHCSIPGGNPDALSGGRRDRCAGRMGIRRSPAAYSTGHNDSHRLVRGARIRLVGHGGHYLRPVSGPTGGVFGPD